MRKELIVLLLYMGTTAAREGELSVPLPDIDTDNREKYECREKELTYQPVASYRISGLCQITDVEGVGDYKYGMWRIKSEIRDFQSSRTVKRFVGGESVYRKEVRIELYRARERPAVLVCETDMKEREVFEANILRKREKKGGKFMEDEKPVTVENGRLPDLGVFTHSREITTMTNRCE